MIGGIPPEGLWKAFFLRYPVRDNENGSNMATGMITRTAKAGRRADVAASVDRAIAIDPYRSIVFPNALRERRLAAAIPSLIALSASIPGIPYIRLAKIERGEVLARAEELCSIARVLGLADPADLLVDVDTQDFAMERWAAEHAASRRVNDEAEMLAMLLAAAFRRLRATAPSLTLARLLEEHRLPSVIVSRIENAVKPFDRWNAETMRSVAALFGVADRDALITLLWNGYENGWLAEWLARIPGAAERQARTAERVGALRTELARIRAWGTDEGALSIDGKAFATSPSSRFDQLQVMGVPLGEGLIEPFPNPQHVAPPPGSGANCYALRMCRASLGATIPGNAVLIVDPDRVPVQGGLAVLREGQGLRVLALSTDKDGRLIGHSSNPEKEIMLDGVSPAELATVTAVLFP